MITLRYREDGIVFIKTFLTKAEMLYWITERMNIVRNFMIISATRNEAH